MPVAPSLPVLLDALEDHHGPPRKPLPRRALDWVLWENAAYLVSDERREAAYRALKKQTGLRPERILAFRREELLAIAELGGMQPERRVDKLLAIAETVEDAFGGDLEAALALPSAKARRTLQKFPGIGAPGADKILLFTGTEARPALESNGLRVLVRLGLVTEGKNYAATYRSGTDALAPLAAEGCPSLVRAFQLLRRHGQAPCKNKAPACDECPLAERCPSAS